MKKKKAAGGMQETANNPYWSRPTLGKSPETRIMQLMSNEYSKSGDTSDMPSRGPVIASPRRTMIRI